VRSKKIYKTACLLPFLRIFDKNADDMYRYASHITPRYIPFQAYCKEPPIEFIVLFTIYFTIVKPYKLKGNNAFDLVYLRKKHELSSYVLSQNDYEAIFDLYLKWLNNKFNKRKKYHIDPLRHSDYEWVVKTRERPAGI